MTLDCYIQILYATLVVIIITAAPKPVSLAGPQMITEGAAMAVGTIPSGALEGGGRIKASDEWRWPLTSLTLGYLLFETISGVVIYAVPASRAAQFGVLVHTAIGLAFLLPMLWYLVRHWWVRRAGKLSHYQLLGYLALILLLVCVGSGLVATWQGAVGPRLSHVCRMVHLASGAAFAAVLPVHLVMVIFRTINNPEALREARTARWSCYLWSAAVCGAMLIAWGAWEGLYREPSAATAFVPEYNWRFGKDRPFAPSMARLEGTEEWKQKVRAGALKLAKPDERGAFQNAMQSHAAESFGVFSQIRRSAEEAHISVSARAEIESLLEGASGEVRQRGAIAPQALAGSAGCGVSGCHTEIYHEWLPSAHRYSSVDKMFQRVQQMMATETSPEHTRYCAGCHDPISLVSGAKNSSNVTLSAEGANEGISCLVCHNIVQTDTQGNGDYTIRIPRRYAYEGGGNRVAEFLSRFIIRSAPRQHVEAYSRPLYKSPEFCAACHKQYIDQEVNTNLGKVLGQNQYDSWKNSRWHLSGDPRRSITCRECHMPLVASNDPARGDAVDYNRSPDDGKHRSHSSLGANQFIPLAHHLEGAEQHTARIEQWLQGKIDVPEIADKWTAGPAIRMSVFAPKIVEEGQEVAVQVLLTNNKAGHDFPTGPLDMIEGWVELTVSDASGRTVFRRGGTDARDAVVDAPVWFKADLFDRRSQTIDHHNLWDLVGARNKRALFPGTTDTAQINFNCPGMVFVAATQPTQTPNNHAPGERAEQYAFTVSGPVEGPLTVRGVLLYRKANPAFLDRVYDNQPKVRTRITQISEAQTTIEVTHVKAKDQ